MAAWAAGCLGGVSPAAGADAPFVHPGMLHGSGDLARIRRHVAAGDAPWSEGFSVFRADPASQADWVPRGPFATVTCGQPTNEGSTPMYLDANAAYQNALMWALTGDASHARRALIILNAWAGTLREMNGHDVQLGAGLHGFKFLNAAELMRHTASGWAPADQARFEAMVRAVILPKVREFATFANGNWDAACVATLLCAGVFLDDRALWNRAVAYYRGGAGNGRLTHYICNAAGQCQESGRDQAHTQLGLGLLAQACEVAWQQGLDLYAEADNRLLRGFEYTARYNLGYEVPFEPHVDTTGKYRHAAISTQSRGRLRPVFEMVWNHYGVRRGLAAPYTAEAARRLRPERAATKGDHPGFGTLLFTQEPRR